MALQRNQGSKAWGERGRKDHTSMVSLRGGPIDKRGGGAWESVNPSARSE